METGRRCLSWPSVYIFATYEATRASQLSEQMAIDDRPKPMSSPINYPAYPYLLELLIYFFIKKGLNKLIILDVFL